MGALQDQDAGAVVLDDRPATIPAHDVRSRAGVELAELSGAILREKPGLVPDVGA